MRAREEGLSLVELVIAMGLLLVIAGGVFGLLTPAQGASIVEPESADLQQRVRVAGDTIFRDLLAAGAGPYAGNHPSALLFAFPAVLPFRSGADPPGTFTTGTITTISVPATAAQTTLAADLAPGATTLLAAREPGCAVGVNLCRFTPGTTLLVYDAAGSFDTFTLAAVVDASAQLQLVSRPAGSMATTFKSGSTVAEAQVDVYYVRVDPMAQTTQLMHGDGSSNADVPVVDHVVGVNFDYYGAPRAPVLTGPPGEMATTYGPSPPPIDVATTAYPAGESCTFQVSGSGTRQVPRLVDLGVDPGLVKLTAAQLTDGPWCPDGSSGNRWDADLLRIRSVVVTVRVEAALAALRGPAGALFANAGSSQNAGRWLPDIERQITVFPRNLNGNR